MSERLAAGVVAKRGKRPHPAGCLDRPAWRAARRLRPPEGKALVMTSPDPTPRQIIVFVLYSVLCLPASMTVAGYAATRITQNVSNFEGGAGYAALWWIVILTCVFYGLSIALCALLRKRIVILAAITVAFAVLAVPTVKEIHDLLN
ncbi:hypothetical protein [Burkholderia sp. Bp8992]|uniref:hypothetical protein n=1 Tax=Burkholderia sp. Bp8992 TaxID=2184554 RepID=UPI0021AB5CDD|nr:hypothetical protein [Burkholderia sp. Bp8992]